MEFFSQSRTIRAWRVAFVLLSVAAPYGAGSAGAQTIPGLPVPAASAPAAPKQKVAAPTKDNPQATVAESTATIDVEKPVDKFKIKDFLEETLAKYPGVYSVHADVDGSVVTLTGHVEDEEVRDRLGQVALKVEGVVFVANQLKTDAQVLSASEQLFKQLRRYRSSIAQSWLLFLLSVVIFLGTFTAARLFARFSETLLAPFTENVMLRSVLGSIIGLVIIAAGMLAALQVFGVASAVASVFGLAGVAALAVGFAFRDITENFIASILLSTRRPFQIGDYVEVAGQAGVVKGLNTRATILLTLEGKTVRIPNAMVFKEIVTNASAASSSRGTFDILIPYEVSTVQATDLIGATLLEHEAILKDPPPRALVEELTPAGVRLRAYYWMPTRNVDGFKVNSDAKLKAKVALQQAGIRPPAAVFKMESSEPKQVEAAKPGSYGRIRANEPIDHAPVVTPTQAKANLDHDSKAAAAAAEVKPLDETMQHVRNMSGGDVTAEGKNLIAGDASKGQSRRGKNKDAQGSAENGEESPGANGEARDKGVADDPQGDKAEAKAGARVEPEPVGK